MNKIQKYFLFAFCILVLYWIGITIAKPVSPIPGYIFSFSFGLIPLIGGAIAIVSSKDWTSFRGLVSRGMFFMGIGLMLWGLGEMIWSYYNFFANVSAPYPSLADLGFAPSVFFYCVGTVFLARAAGADFGLKKPSAKMFIIIAPLVMFFLSYYVLVTVARDGTLYTPGDPVLKAIFDIVYPLGDFISLTFAVVVSGLAFKYLTREYHIAILSVVIGLAVMFIADSVFSYTTTLGTYYNGNFGDLIFLTALFLLTFGTLGFKGRSVEIPNVGMNLPT